MTADQIKLALMDLALEGHTLYVGHTLWNIRVIYCNNNPQYWAAKWGVFHFKSRSQNVMGKKTIAEALAIVDRYWEKRDEARIRASWKRNPFIKKEDHDR